MCSLIIHKSVNRLTSILLSGFILDLRTIYLANASESQGTQNMTSLQFVATFQDNLGASLHASWLTDTDSSTEDEEIRFSEHPFVAGLLEPEHDRGRNVG